MNYSNHYSVCGLVFRDVITHTFISTSSKKYQNIIEVENKINKFIYLFIINTIIIILYFLGELFFD